VALSAVPKTAAQQGEIIAYGSNPIRVNQTLNTAPINGVLPSDNTIWLLMTKQGDPYTTS
jgi:hypothetical protein